jgi:hypothetical protein
MKGYLPADQYEYDGGEQVRWVCQFVDWWIFRCTATIGTSQLYVERFDVLGESPDPDPDPKVPAKAGKKADVA